MPTGRRSRRFSRQPATPGSQAIRGITLSSLHRAWRSIRKLLRDATFRDVADYIDYDVDPQKWMRRLLSQIADGSYVPHVPQRFPLAKGYGFSRRLTYPHVPDLVLYRAAIDCLSSRLRRHQHKHVYFLRAQRTPSPAPTTPDGSRLERAVSQYLLDYRTGSTSHYRAWLHYNQYRRQLIFSRVYPYIVTTDIANYFDSILFAHIGEALYAATPPSRLVGLIFLLLEHFASRGALTESARVGLPIDEFDCSRHLAHMVLFPHDDRIVSMVGEDAYVRWMDDQLIGTQSREQGLKVLASVGDSLSRLHLTPNTGKTKLLTTTQARRVFHLDLNDALDAAQALRYGTTRERRILRSRLLSAWRTTKKYRGEGHWDKVLKRFYLMSGRARSRYFRRQALKDLLLCPDLAPRIVDYVRCTGTVSEYLSFADAVWRHPEQIYPDVNLAFVEGA